MYDVCLVEVSFRTWISSVVRVPRLLIASKAKWWWEYPILFQKKKTIEIMFIKYKLNTNRLNYWTRITFLQLFTLITVLLALPCRFLFGFQKSWGREWKAGRYRLRHTAKVSIWHPHRIGSSLGNRDPISGSTDGSSQVRDRCPDPPYSFAIESPPPRDTLCQIDQESRRKSLCRRKSFDMKIFVSTWKSLRWHEFHIDTHTNSAQVRSRSHNSNFRW